MFCWRKRPASYAGAAIKARYYSSVCLRRHAHSRRSDRAGAVESTAWININESWTALKTHDPVFAERQVAQVVRAFQTETEAVISPLWLPENQCTQFSVNQIARSIRPGSLIRKNYSLLKLVDRSRAPCGFVPGDSSMNNKMVRTRSDRNNSFVI